MVNKEMYVAGITGSVLIKEMSLLNFMYRDFSVEPHHYNYGQAFNDLKRLDSFFSLFYRLAPME